MSGQRHSQPAPTSELGVVVGGYKSLSQVGLFPSGNWVTSLQEAKWHIPETRHTISVLSCHEFGQNDLFSAS